MKNPISKRQKDLLAVIYEYIKNTGYPPAFDEMKDLLGVSSNQSVIDLLDKLERKEILKRKEGTALSIAILPLGYDILGQPYLTAFLGATSAGAPIEALEIRGNWINPAYFRKPSHKKVEPNMIIFYSLTGKNWHIERPPQEGLNKRNVPNAVVSIWTPKSHPVIVD